MKIVALLILLIETVTSMQAQIGSPVYNMLVNNKSNTNVTWDGHGYLVDEPVWIGEDEDGEEIWIPFQKYYDVTGEELFDGGNYTDIQYIPEGDCFIFYSGGYGIAGPRGDHIVDPWSDNGYDNILCIISENEKGKRWIDQFKVKRGKYAGVLDAGFKEILAPTKYTDAEYNDDRHLFVVKQDDRGGVLDKDGKELRMFPHTGFITVSERNENNEGWFVFVEENGNKQYLCSYKGQLLWTAENYDLSEREGLVAVMEDGLWGYIDVKTGKMMIPAQYTSAEPFSGGVAKVSKGNESFLISNPLQNGGVSKIVSSLSVNARSDIDLDIPETQIVQENTFVVIIANQDHQNFSVPYAKNDGQVFKEYCLKTLGVPKSNVLYYENATLNTFTGVISRIKDLADVYEGDAKVLFYFSGQGVCDQKGNPYLLPSDGLMNMVSSTGYALSALYSEMGNLNTVSTTILLDASFNNLDREGKTLDGGNRNGIKCINPSIDGKLIVINAADSGESALSYQEKSHGLFTYFLCKRIRENNGNVTVKELSDYLSSQVARVSALLGGRQNPQTRNTSGQDLKNVQL